MGKVWKKISTFITLTFATSLCAFGVYFFRLPNHFSTGGAAGIGVLLGELIPGASAGSCTAVLNILFVLVGFAFLGRSFGWKTIYCSILFSAVLQVLEWIIPLSNALTDQKMLELFFATFIPAIGSVLLFKQGASSGGTEVAALVMKKYTDLDTGKACFVLILYLPYQPFFYLDWKQVCIPVWVCLSRLPLSIPLWRSCSEKKHCLLLPSRQSRCGNTS